MYTTNKNVSVTDIHFCRDNSLNLKGLKTYVTKVFSKFNVYKCLHTYNF